MQSKTSIRLDRLDVAVLVVILGLLLSIGLVIVHGDQVGIRLSDFGPQNLASSRPTVHATFDEPVDTSSVNTHFSIEPTVDGKINVHDNQVTFQPKQALTQGQDYTVTFHAGLEAQTGRQLKQDVQWHFQIAPPRVIYEGPVDSIVQNLYLVDPSNPTMQPQKLTTLDEGIVNGSFAVAPDGSGILYAAFKKGGKGSSDLYLWDATTGTSSMIYECKDAACTDPAWRPDGGAIAFDRAELNTGTGLPPGVPRVWILDMTTKTAQPLFSTSQRLGLLPHWSPDGSKVAVYDADSAGIVIHDFTANTDKIIQTDQGQIGDFSPDGKWVYFPKVLLLNPQQYVSHVVLVDITSDAFVQKDLIPDSDPGDDVEAVWQADSKGLIVGRITPSTAQSSAGPSQIYSIDVATGKTTPLVVDLTYSNSNIALSPDGSMILLQRQLTDPPGQRPEIWTYNLKTNELKMLAKNGSLPKWIP